MHRQQHFRVDMAAHREGAGAREINLDRLAGRLLRRVEAHCARSDIDLVQKFVFVRKQHGVAAGNRDLGDGKIPSLLCDSVNSSSGGGERYGKDEQKKKRDKKATASA